MDELIYRNSQREINRRLQIATEEQQKAKMDTYISLKNKRLPIPSDLKAECESVLGDKDGS